MSRALPIPHSTFPIRPARRAFTLVEMLVVISIIAILAGLVTAVVFTAIPAAKRAAIRAEINNLHMAFQEYQRNHRDYPPSNMRLKSDTNAREVLKRHLAAAFPKCNPDVELNALRTDPTNSSSDFHDMSPAEALLFWLSGISKDPRRPFSALVPASDRTFLFEFDRTRITPGGWEVVPANGSAPAHARYTPHHYLPPRATEQPYVYFEARDYLAHALDPNPNNGGQICCPYLLEPWGNGTGNLRVTSDPNTADVIVDNNRTILYPQSFRMYQKLCVNPKSFQIICAGLDGDFGTEPNEIADLRYYNPTRQVVLHHKSYPSGNIGYSTADDDNLTNFTEGMLGDAKP